MTHPSLTLYHATKWGMEGFSDSDANAVAPQLEAYRNGPVEMLLLPPRNRKRRPSG